MKKIRLKDSRTLSPDEMKAIVGGLTLKCVSSSVCYGFFGGSSVSGYCQPNASGASATCMCMYKPSVLSSGFILSSQSGMFIPASCWTYE